MLWVLTIFAIGLIVGTFTPFVVETQVGRTSTRLTVPAYVGILNTVLALFLNIHGEEVVNDLLCGLTKGI